MPSSRDSNQESTHHSRVDSQVSEKAAIKLPKLSRLRSGLSRWSLIPDLRKVYLTLAILSGLLYLGQARAEALTLLTSL